MADTLYRYDEPTGQWVIVTNINRIEIVGGGGYTIGWNIVDISDGIIKTTIDIPV